MSFYIIPDEIVQHGKFDDQNLMLLELGACGIHKLA